MANIDAFNQYDFFLMVTIIVFVFWQMFPIHFHNLWRSEMAEEFIENQVKPSLDMRHGEERYKTEKGKKYIRMSFDKWRTKFIMTWANGMWWYVMIANTALVIGWMDFNVEYRNVALSGSFTSIKRDNNLFLINVLVLTQQLMQKAMPSFLNMYKTRSHAFLAWIAAVANLAMAGIVWGFVGSLNTTTSWILFGLYTFIPIGMLFILILLWYLASQFDKQDESNMGYKNRPNSKGSDENL